MAEEQHGEEGVSEKNGDAVEFAESGTETPEQAAKAVAGTYQVDFLAGKIKIPLSSLAEWIPGKVVEHEGVFYPKVKAICNGKTIAEGELVDVGEQIGFRVTRLVK